MPKRSPYDLDEDELPKCVPPLPLRGHRHANAQVQAQVQTSTKRRSAEIIRELKQLHSMPPADDENETKSEEYRPITRLEQLQQLRLSRHRIEQLLTRPGFEQALPECFVRLNIMAEDEPAEHRVAEIISVVALTVGYYVGTTPTNVALQLRFDDLVEQHDLNAISNIAFEQDEFDMWRDNCVGQAIDPPSTERIARKRVEIYNALNLEAKRSPFLGQNWMLPMRPAPKGGLVERKGVPYPWRLERPMILPELPALAALPAIKEEKPLELPVEPELEIMNEELEAKRALEFEIKVAQCVERPTELSEE